jgi:hypothetical protein
VTFSIFSYFLHIQPVVFKPPDKIVILRVCDVFILRCSLRPESSQEHLQTRIAGVLRLRAIKLSVCDKSAKRFAQDDDFVGV